MANQSIGEEQEALFQSSPCALYYVQSPSTASHANSHPSESAFLSPFTHETFDNNQPREGSRFTLSRYSSSRGSNNSFLHEKKMAYDLQSNDSRFKSGGRQRLKIITGDEDDDAGNGIGRRNGLWKLVSLDPSSSFFCVTFQVIWRLLLSMGLALFVFYLATKPPAPKVSFKIAAVRQFHLGEGLDNTGVVTKILTCNCSMDMEVDNYSKVFGLHIRPPTVEMAFGRFKFASSQGEESYVGSESSLTLRQYVGAKNKPTYGAGRSMQDLLESGRGLPLVVRVKSRSSYHVVWNLIRPRYHHHAECLLILKGSYDEQHHTQTYNSTCVFSPSHA
ncbi:hypothetical protein COCNU_05G004190 [Cocos nucifera]|uniref:Late embryogenesis abundant protein LEA-2 subgroup domain-containing protein n=1 Tax=Cocos nucifera TaxID=13894 RepID=A0A8K0N1E3_COCNU|nr:hypothetical protein COCNU_05G004190 [Cocos nucifera]